MKKKSMKKKTFQGCAEDLIEKQDMALSVGWKGGAAGRRYHCITSLINPLGLFPLWTSGRSFRLNINLLYDVAIA